MRSTKNIRPIPVNYRGMQIAGQGRGWSRCLRPTSMETWKMQIASSLTYGRFLKNSTIRPRVKRGDIDARFLRARARGFVAEWGVGYSEKYPIWGAPTVAPSCANMDIRIFYKWAVTPSQRKKGEEAKFTKIICTISERLQKP